MDAIAILNDMESRKKSIIENAPARFEIEDNPYAFGEEPFYEFEIASQVNTWRGLIIQISKRNKIDSNLVMAIMYMETTHGWYDIFYPFRKNHFTHEYTL